MPRHIVDVRDKVAHENGDRLPGILCEVESPHDGVVRCSLHKPELSLCCVDDSEQTRGECFPLGRSPDRDEGSQDQGHFLGGPTDESINHRRPIHYAPVSQCMTS
jgi:hypothetical protein